MHMMYLAGIFLVTYGFFSWKYPKSGLVFLVSTIPLYLVSFTIAGIPSTLLEGMILISFALYLVRAIIEGRLKEDFYRVCGKNRIFHGMVLLFLASAFLASTYSVDIVRAIGILKAYFIEPILVFYLLLYLFDTRKELEKTLLLSAFVVFLVSFAAIIQYIFDIRIPEGYEYPKRATSFFPYPAGLALYILPQIVMGGVLLARNYFTDTKEVILLWLSVIFGFIALMLSRAEGGIGAFFVVSVLAGLLIKRFRLLTIGVVVGAIIIVILVPGLLGYLIEVMTFNDVSGQVRLAVWEGTLNLLKANPIVGAGLASFPEMYDQFRLARHVELLLYPHMIFLNFWVELGIMGLLSFVGIVLYLFFVSVSFLREKMQSLKNHILVLAAICALLAIMIYGLVDVPYFKNDLAVQFFFIAAIILSVVNSTQLKTSKNE